MQSPAHYEITTDHSRMDVAFIRDFLSSSYWAENIPQAIVERSIKNSLCFGAFLDGRQVGFARAITDYATFAYVADVFVVTEHRGHGVSKLMMRAIVEHPDLQGLRRLLLATRDAHGLYAQFGFVPITQPENFMTIHKETAYLDVRSESSL